MSWNELFPQGTQPTLDEIAAYIGDDAREVWQSLLDHLETVYHARPKLTYSVCAGKPGWNVKFQKSGVAFGTFYPEAGAFTVFMVISHKLAPAMEAIIDNLTPATAARYRNAGDYMKIGRWMMWQIRNPTDLDDLKTLFAIKLPPKG